MSREVSVQRHRDVMASVHSAMLGEIVPNLRAIFVEFDETSVHLRAVFDGPISVEDAEHVNVMETYVIADLPEDNRVTHSCHRLDAPHPLDFSQGTCAFLRHEPQPGDSRG
jgi:hypothetical protein